MIFFDYYYYYHHHQSLAVAKSQFSKRKFFEKKKKKKKYIYNTTINQINECNKFAQKENKTRHDWVGKVIHWE